jgi:hypothetical protein
MALLPWRGHKHEKAVRIVNVCRARSGPTE